MTKEEAAELLEVSTRAVERYTKQGRLSVTYEKGKTRSVAVYDRAELERLKEELKQPVYPARPVVVSSEESSQALTTTRPDHDVSEIVAILARALERAAPPAVASRPSLTEIAVKMVLSLKEAAALSGIPRARLLEAIESGKLKAGKDTIARGWRVKRDNLDAYVKKL
jgi:excisionase family DNA binding protein